MTPPRPSPAVVAQALRRQLDADMPGWRRRLAAHAPGGLLRVKVVAEVSGVGRMEVVLYVRGGAEGEALPDEVIP